ncbi:unnamed protein product, partial [Heligmosomoides polygyrus]|uniref:Pecanex-like protein n=1 Tax=Heligmosomoides polygyrus TaxID=6339 RepID=A0A183FBW3_HELPZ
AYKPRHSSYVTASELDHIRGKRPKGSDDIRAVKHTPLKQILLSPCVIAICISSYTQSFIVTGLLAFLPLFNYLALNMDLVQVRHLSLHVLPW